MDKNNLRRSYLTARKSLTQLEIQSKGYLINQRLINLVPWHSLQLVHLYLPVLDKNEVDTLPTINHIRSHYEKLSIAVPKVEPAQILSHHLLTESTKLIPNLWGIPEPVGNSTIAIEQIDLVIAPMIIFDKTGHRIGYGKGYYDRFLAQCRPDSKKIGLCYFDPVEKIETEPTDISMDAVITPEGVWKFD